MTYKGELDDVKPGEIGAVNAPEEAKVNHSVLSTTLIFGSPIALVFAFIAYNGFFG